MKKKNSSHKKLIRIHNNIGAGQQNAVTRFQPVTIQGKKKPGVKGLEFGVYIIAVRKQDDFGSQEHKNLLSMT